MLLFVFFTFKRVFLEISQNSKENNCARVSSVQKLCQSCSSKNTSPYRTPPVAASVKWMKPQSVWKIGILFDLAVLFVSNNISFLSNWQCLSNFAIEIFRKIFFCINMKNFSDVMFSILIYSSILYWICTLEIQFHEF